MNNKYSGRLLQAIESGRLGLTSADFMTDDALTKHIRNSKVGFVNKLKRTIEEIKTSDDDVEGKSKKQRFREIFKTEPDFEIEKSDSESVDTQKNDHGDGQSVIQSIASEAVITDDEIDEILQGDNEDKYHELITGLNQAQDNLIMEDLSGSDIEKKEQIKIHDITNTREIKVTQSIIEDAIKGVEDKQQKLKTLKEQGEYKANEEIELIVDTMKSESRYGRMCKPTEKVLDAAKSKTEVKSGEATDKIQKKIIKNDIVKKQFESLIIPPSKKVKNTEEVFLPPPPPEETKKDPIPFTNAFELYPTTFDNIIERIADETKKEIFKRAAHISSAFSGIDNFDDQVTLLKSLTSDDKDFFNISDCDMESFFNSETQSVYSGMEKAGKDAEGAKTWKDIVKHKPNVVFSKATDVSSGYFERPDDINNSKTFFQLAYYSKKILGPMTLLARLSNRTKAILNNPLPIGSPNEVHDSAKSVGAQTSASSYFDFHNMEDEYMDYIGNSQMSDLTYYDFSEDEDIPGAADDEFEGGKKGGSKKKSKNTSQKKGGFLKGILKKITTCDCDKQGKRKDNKTRRRGGKKFTIRKKKKSGGKHTYRKKKGGKKQKRVRFTVKN
jgi:hypothetical protein